MMKLTSLMVKAQTRGSVAKAKSTTKVKSKITAKVALLGSALLLAFGAQAADKNYDNLHKQLNIMNDIMMSSAKRRRIHVSP